MLVLTLAALAGVIAYVRFRPPIAETSRLQRGDLMRTVVTSGVVEAPRRTLLGAEVGGRVVEVAVEVGAHVEGGALLAQLDDAAARAQVDEANAAVREALAQLARLRRTGVRVALAAEAAARAAAEQAAEHFQRTESLTSSGALAQSDLEVARRERDATAARLQVAETEAESASRGGADVRVAVAALRRTQAALRSAERRVAQMAIRAPAAGRVLERIAEPGRVVQPGQALFEFVADGAPRLVVHPDESHLAFVRVDQPAHASVESHPNDVFGATVSRIAPAVDAARGTVEVELSIAGDAPEYLLPGMTASVEIELATVEDTLIAPAEAIRTRGDEAGVWVVDGDGVLTFQAVTQGLTAGDFVALESGPDEGARVVVAIPGGDDDVLQVGGRVRIHEGN